MFKASGSNQLNKEICPEGTYPGRVFYMVDLGTQTDTFKGETKTKRKVRIAVELTGATMEDGRPFAVGKDFNLNLGRPPKPGESTGFVNPLTNLIRAITGKPVPTGDGGAYEYDLEDLIGGVALFQITHTEKGNAKMASFMPLPKGMPVDPPANPAVVLSLEPSEFNLETYYLLSDYWQQTICKSPEGKALKLDQIDPADIARAKEVAKQKKASGTNVVEDPNDDLGIPF